MVVSGGGAAAPCAPPPPGSGTGRRYLSFETGYRVLNEARMFFCNP